MTFFSIFALVFQINTASLVNSLTIPGTLPDATPLKGIAGGANINRLGGFGSDLYYDRAANLFYGLADRGPGGGTIPYDTRVHKFTLSIDPTTGAAGGFQLLSTIYFTIPATEVLHGIKGPTALNGLDPSLDPTRRSAANSGRSFDPEGFVVGRNGHFYVSDEYGPSIYEFLPNGTFVREFSQPENVRPRDSKGLNFSGFTSVTVTRGRQRNRGFEGLAISPDGNTLFALLQDPMAEEGSNAGCSAACTPAGRYSPNVRLIAYSASSGKSVAQYIYRLESLATINARVPMQTFAESSQGASMGLSGLTAISDHEFLVIERDNRGFGIDETAASAPVASKRIYRIDIARATDVSRISLVQTNSLPKGVVPVAKELFLDIAAELQKAGTKIPEKIEGLTLGPQLSDGTYALLVASDNDFSVTQNDTSTQFDVCSDGKVWQQVAIDAGCPAGLSLIPTYLFSFKTAPVTERRTR